jgi:hypothetical protein
MLLKIAARHEIGRLVRQRSAAGSQAAVVEPSSPWPEDPPAAMIDRTDAGG